MPGGTPLDQLEQTFDPTQVELQSHDREPMPGARQPEIGFDEEMGRPMDPGGAPRRSAKRVAFEDADDIQKFIMREYKLPVAAGLLFFLLNQDIVDVQLLKYIPKLFSSNELTMTGVAVKAGLLTVLLLLAKKYLF